MEWRNGDTVLRVGSVVIGDDSKGVNLGDKYNGLPSYVVTHALTKGAETQCFAVAVSKSCVRKPGGLYDRKTSVQLACTCSDDAHTWMRATVSNLPKQGPTTLAQRNVAAGTVQGRQAWARARTGINTASNARASAQKGDAVLAALGLDSTADADAVTAAGATHGRDGCSIDPELLALHGVTSKVVLNGVAAVGMRNQTSGTLNGHRFEAIVRAQFLADSGCANIVLSGVLLVDDDGQLGASNDGRFIAAPTEVCPHSHTPYIAVFAPSFVSGRV
jgi:hypothetical protein